jgi:hypothetical protein
MVGMDLMQTGKINVKYNVNVNHEMKTLDMQISLTKATKDRMV